MLNQVIIDPDKFLIFNMTNSPKLRTPLFARIFGIILAITLIIWLLRGLGVLTFIPGGIIWLLLFLSIGTGVISTLQRR